MTTASTSAPATTATPAVVTSSFFILMMSPTIFVSPFPTAVKTILAAVNKFLLLQPEDGDNPHEPMMRTSLIGSFVVHSKLLDQPLPLVQSTSEPTWIIDESNLMTT